MMFQSFEQPSDGAHGAARLSALRERLRALAVDGFLVPRADAHQGEMVAPRDERLAFLSGFTGSAGLAIVLMDRAALLVDGRYTLQAADQADAALFEIVPVHETSAADWVKRVLQAGQTLAYDPWLHGKAEIDRLAQAAAARSARLVAIEPNPIDAIWADQPPPPMGSVRIQPDALAGESPARRRHRIGALIRDSKADAAVLTQPDSLAWLLNIRGSDLPRSPVALGFAVIDAGGAVSLYMEPDKIDGAVMAHLGNEVSLSPPDRLGEGLDAMAGKAVLVDKATCPLWVANRLEAASARLEWGEDPCLRPKALKNAAELAGMRAAHLRDGAAMTRFLHWLDTAAERGDTLTEIGVVSALERFRAGTGELMDIAFDTICGSGPNGAIVHYRVTRASNRTLCPGDLLLVDSGGQYRDGTTDITRTVAIGPVDEAARRPFSLVLKGMIAVSRARWPEGVAGRDLDPLARAALWRAGFDYDHGTGHGVGAYLNVHEGPQRLSRRGGDARLEPGMIVSNEPGHYVAGRFGIRTENLLAVTEPSVPEGGDRPMLGFETLTLAPIDRRLVDPAVLGAEDVDWLDRYHARVSAEIGDALDRDDDAVVRLWLERACAPLE
jgi:Xaa-Pro aminopeptidase